MPAAAAPDTEAFEAFIRLHQRKVFALVYRYLRDVEEANQLTQDAFLQAYQNWGRLREEQAASAWILRIASNLCLDYFRRPAYARTERLGSEAAGVPASREKDIEATLIRHELLGRVRAAARLLPGRQRAVFTLRHYEELPLEEIGRLMGIGIGAVKSHLSRAVRRIRKELEHESSCCF
jgi:RNA polymerase sigma-70 factor (ECF subfamily)